MLGVGIDIGSLSTDAVLLNDRGDILASVVIATGASSKKAAEAAYEQLLKDSGVNKGDIGVVIATGYGRIKVPFANEVVTEITCHAKGANYYFPNARTLIDIGGQDSKAIRLDAKGNVVDFVMNDKCAAGTGRFLEVMARALQIDLEDMGEISLKGRDEISISSLCTVFAESEVVSLIGVDHKVEDIGRSLHASIAKRIIAQVKRVGIEDDVVMSGGVAKNIGVVHELGKGLGHKIHISPEPQIVGALGAALIGLEKAKVKTPCEKISNQRSIRATGERGLTRISEPAGLSLEPSVHNFDIEDSPLPKIGYFCSYIPVEIIRAAGFHPIRIRGMEGDGSAASEILCGNICPYIKSVTDQKLSGKLDGLKGVVFTNSCDGMRRLYDAWVRLDGDERFNYIIDLPKNVNEQSIAYFAHLLRGFKERLEKYFDLSVSRDDINSSISVYNKVREKVKLFLQRQWNGYVGHSGYEMFHLFKRGINAVPEKFSEYLTFIMKMKQREHVFDLRKAPSLLLWGGIVENEGLVKVIEDAGARVVADDLCSGSRYYDSNVDITSDPYLALAKRYLTRIPCSRMTDVTKRISNVLRIIKEHAISGSIYHSLKFCDHNLYDFTIIKRRFDTERIPLLALNCDYNPASEGQLRTRVEAFIEQIMARKVVD